MTLYFPDISAFQAGIDLAGAKAVIVKATEGTGWSSPDYTRAKANAAQHGTFFMAYHFLHHGSDAAQATFAHGVAGSAPMMIDCEPTVTSRPTVGDAAGFADAYRHAGGTVHLVYLPHWYWQQLGSPSLKVLADAGLCLVSSAYTTYTDASTGTGWQPYGGMTPVIWQYTDRLSFNGHDVDFNAFRGSFAGDQDAASVAGALTQLKSAAITGKIAAAPVAGAVAEAPEPPVMRLASGKESLRHAAHREGTTVQRAIWLMAMGHKDDQGFGQPLQAAYVAKGDYNAIMPAKMVYWVG